MKSKCEQQIPELLFELPAGVPIETVLLNIAHGFHRLINSDESIELHRVLITHGAQNPKMSQMFYDAGPQRLIDGMEQLLTQATLRGLLQVSNPLVAADQFFCLVKGGCNFRLLIGCGTPPSEDEQTAQVHATVDLFVRAYRP